MDYQNKRQRFIFWGIVLGIIAAVLTLIPSVTKAEDKGLLWIGLGDAEGHYEEGYFSIDQEVEGVTYEYMEYRTSTQKSPQSLIKSSSGSTKSWFVHYTLFDPVFYDDEGRKHELSFTEIIPYWGRGYTYTIHLSDKLDLITSADAFLGLGFITFEKDIVGVQKFEYKFGFDIGYGWGLNAIFKWDDNWFFGWRSLDYLNNRITLDYGDSIGDGYLTHRRDILLVLGTTFSGSSPSCVPTAYQPC